MCSAKWLPIHFCETTSSVKEARIILHPQFLDEVAGRFACCFFSWTEMQLQMIKRDENKLPMRLKSGLLKLYIIKHFLGEDYSSCKNWQLVPVPGSLFPLLPSFNRTCFAPCSKPNSDVTTFLKPPWLLSWLSLVCCFCTLRVFIFYTGLWALWRQNLGLFHLCSLTLSWLPGK